jgi:multidrug transporter EmrE-like cation transporter
MSKLNFKKTSMIVLLFSVILNAGGQVFFKLERSSCPDCNLISILSHSDTWIGFILYGLSAVCWLWVLSRTQLSFAYPLLSLSFPIVVVLSVIYFAEVISPVRWIGVGLIVIGVSLISRT